MNILYRSAASINGHESRVLNRLHEEKAFEKAVVITCDLDGKDVYDDSIYTLIESKHCATAQYYKVVDVNNLPSIEEDIWQKMLVYKWNIIQMIERERVVNVRTIDEIELEYLNAIYYWDNIIKSHDIKLSIFSVTPHMAWEYIIYALSKVYNIPTLIYCESWIPGLCSVGTSIKNMGENVKENINKNFCEELSEYEKGYYLEKSKNNKSLSAKNKRILQKQLNDWCEKTFFRPFYRSLFKLIIAKYNFIKDKNSFKYLEEKKSYELDIRSNIKRKKIKTIKYYDKHLASNLDDVGDYIVFFVQQMPEQTTLPSAGIFCNQLISIKILSDACDKLGVKLVIKDHYQQLYPPFGFYERLREYKNIIFAKTDFDSFELASKAICVASQTGSILLEAIIRGIPGLSFGYSPLNYGPGIYKVGSKEDVISAIKDIKDNYSYNKNCAYKFYKTLCMSSLRSKLDGVNSPFSEDECINDVVNYVSHFIEGGMNEKYCYIRQHDSTNIEKQKVKFTIDN